MEIIRTIEAFRTALDWRRKDQTLALVATQGNLHDGHVALFKTARDRADITVASIYRNPLREPEHPGVPEHPFDDDRARLTALSVDFLFAPDDTEMFPAGTDDSLLLYRRGESAPEPDARGTVWLKLVNTVRPELVVCGEKDYEQLVMLRRLFREYAVAAELVAVPVARDADGVALSGELERLTAEQRKIAPILQQTLTDLAVAIRDGARNYAKLEQTARIALKGGGFATREVTIRDADDWSAPGATTERLRIVAEAALGQVLLSDNIGVEL